MKTDQTRRRFVVLRVREGEREMLHNAARMERATLSDWARRVLFAAAAKTLNDR